MYNNVQTTDSTPELVPIKTAAKQLNLHYRQLLSSIQEGLVPTYRLRRGRTLVSVEEIKSIMKRHGGENS